MQESMITTMKAQKSKELSTKNITEQQDYYVNKPWKLIEDLPSHLPFSDQYKQYHTESIPKLQKYYKQNIGYCIHKGQLQEPSYSCKNVVTGWTNSNVNYEFHSKTIDNLFYGLYHRFFASHLYVDDQQVENFKSFCKGYTSDLIRKLDKFNYDYVLDYNPIKDINQREGFSQAKKDNYTKQLMREIKASSISPGSFQTMLKGGEIYTTEQININNNIVTNVSERPRTICNPSKQYCGLLTLLQKLFWPALKQVMPGFIQGFSKKQIQQLFTSKVTPNMFSHSIDGSAFEST